MSLVVVPPMNRLPRPRFAIYFCLALLALAPLALAGCSSGDSTTTATNNSATSGSGDGATAATDGAGGTAATSSGTATTASPSDGTAGSAPQGSDAAASVRRIVVLINGDSPFWDACRAGIKDADKELKLKDAGLRAVLETNDGTVPGQLDKLRQLRSQTDIAAVAVSAIEGNNVAVYEELKKLRHGGLPVITIDSDVDREKFRDGRFAFIGTDNYAAGKELGICLQQILPEGGDYVTFVGRTGAQNAIERVRGIEDAAGEKFKRLDNMGDETDRTRARENVRNAVTNHPSLKALVGIWSYNAPAIVDVVKERNLRDRVKVVVFDAEPQTVKHMAEGLVDAMVVQNPYQMGYQGVRMLKAMVENDEPTLRAMLPNLGQPEGDIFDTGLKVVGPDEGSPLKQEHFSPQTQYMPLKDFQAWLDENGLVGS
jgi:ribose transport system substrate-binding protein